MKKLLLTAFVGLCALAAQATANITGYWTTIDDETKEAKSVVQIYEYNGAIYGRVVKLLQNPSARADIPGNPPVLNMDIIWGLKKDDDTYSGGHVLDPQKGRVYRCEMWREGNTLVMRGKLGIFWRDQRWQLNTSYRPTSTATPTPRIPRVD